MTDTTSRTTPGSSAPQTTGSSAQQAKDEAAGVASAAKGEAANVASTAKQEAGAVAQTAVDEAKQLTAEAGQQAKQVLVDARQQLQAKADEEARRLAGAIDDLSTQLRSMAAAGQSGLARDLVAQAADGTRRFAQQLQQGGLDRTFSDARRLARNKPGTFLLGAAAAGFVAARVARSADTTALKEAASPNGGQGSDNGASQLGQGTLGQSTLGPSTLGQEPDLTLGATQPRPTPQSSSTAGTARPGSPPPTASRPLVAGDTP